MIVTVMQWDYITFDSPETNSLSSSCFNYLGFMLNTPSNIEPSMNFLKSGTSSMRCEMVGTVSFFINDFIRKEMVGNPPSVMPCSIAQIMHLYCTWFYRTSRPEHCNLLCRIQLDTMVTTTSIACDRIDGLRYHQNFSIRDTMAREFLEELSYERVRSSKGLIRSVIHVLYASR